MGKAKTRWLEISIQVDHEGFEAVTELFDRYGQGGAVVETRATGPGRLSVETPPESPIVQVKMYLPADRERRRQSKAIEIGLRDLRKRYPISETEIRELAEEDWAEEWKKGYEIQKTGRRLVIVPSWKQYSPQPDEAVVTMDPGMAFGTGLHPTTRLCLIALERYLRTDEHVLDVGTGSGILAIAAVKLGAGPVTACDIEAAAVEFARRNVIENGVSDHVELHTGTLQDLGSKIQPAHLIVVNILAYTIIKMLPDLKAKLLSGGHLISGGILKEYAPDVEAAVKQEGFEVIETFQEGEWVTIVARVPAS